MRYQVEFKPRAVRDLDSLPQHTVERIIEKLGMMSDNLVGDVKRLTNFTPEYRLRVGEYRVLFELVGNRIVVYHVRHRKEAYER